MFARPLYLLPLLLLLPLGVARCADPLPAPVAMPDVANAPDQVRPLLLGSALPDVSLRTLEGESVALRDAVAGKPALIVFYRGGWCPYCSLQLQGLRLVREPLEKLGFRILAISPDSPTSLRATLDKTPTEYTLLSDSGADAVRAFGLAFRLDDQTIVKYRAYGIDLEQASGQSHHILPVPGVFLFDAGGVLQFSYAHPDYTVRMPEKVILAAAEAIRDGDQKLESRRQP